MRINRFLSAAGLGSRRKCEEFVTAGRVRVNGKKCTLSADVLIEDKVMLDGVTVSLPTDFVYLMMHKPKGYLTTVKDDRGRRTVMDLLPPEFKFLKPVGRLDYNSEGLLLFTNDGNAAEKLMRPEKKTAKTYVVKVEGEVQPSQAEEIERGVKLVDGTRFLPCSVKILETKNRKTRLEIQIFEGKNREIRKIFDKFGMNVVFLKRTAIGKIKLGGLTRGTCRTLRQSEILYIKSL